MSTSNNGEKLYRCSSCGHEYKTYTNHFGSHWGQCPMCKGSDMKICIEPEAEKAREDAPVITAVFKYYRFDTAKEEELDKYKWLCEFLGEGLSMEVFSTYGDRPYMRKAKSLHDTEVKLESLPSALFNNQWNQFEGSRLHDWYETINPNPYIKEGYYLLLPEEAYRLRESHAYCHWCGERPKVEGLNCCPSCGKREYLYRLDRLGWVKFHEEKAS